MSGAADERKPSGTTSAVAGPAPQAAAGPVEVAIETLASLEAVARAAGGDASVVLQWQRRGHVSVEFMGALRSAAASQGRALRLEELVWGRGSGWEREKPQAASPLERIASELTRQSRG